ncbi:hypothetical protein FNZ56_03930 [Pseudoluteimonas lycopersici]|uniref:ParB/Sulfiredoxin domain-containing protein n=1 Tax=Pseudoluteimonas lycopersici TaxID=1324796 RepID=A0A516V3H6_9GAMM|nr:ParB N-terminal domain-containing protein [Lysobacter lycopersici]QDQ73080.1 hypothetical protein FNZ56_03930 [Lysobacter lycopersici]
MAKLETLKLGELHFDPENPRLPETLNRADDPAVLQYLLLEANLIELMLSIGEQGYFEGEPLLAVRREEGGYIVVEGNRRLGALKLLQPGAIPPVQPKQVKEAQETAKHHPDSIPVLIFDKRSEILSYLGYRHITGIKEWNHLAKARYLRQLRERYSELNHTEAHKILAKEIGSNSAQVAKLLTGLTLLDRARDVGLLNALRLREEDVPFSLLTTGIGYENIARFIGIANAADVDAANLKVDEFGEFFAWVFDKRYGAKSVLGESRNFDKLARVVANERAVATLRSGATLEEADLLTSGPLEAVRKFMHLAENNIRSAQDSLSFAEGFDENDVSQADRIRKAAAALAGSLNSLMTGE